MEITTHKGIVRISDGCSLPCVFNGSDPHTIRGGGSFARATTQGEKGQRPAKARDRPAPAIRRTLASHLIGQSLVRVRCDVRATPERAHSDSGDSGRAAYRPSIGYGVTELLNDFF